MKILDRYVLKEHVGPLAFALAALTSLLLLNYIARQFANLVGKGLGWNVIAEFFVLSVPFTIAMTLPMAVLVSTLYAFSRLAQDNEVTALKASGLGIGRLLVPVLWAGAALALAMVGFNDQVLPRANHRLRVLQADIARKKPTFALREQVINEVQPGRLFMRTTRLDESSNRMRDVTIYDLADPQRRRTIYADSGTMGFSENLADLELTLYSGVMHEIDRQTGAQLQRLYYRTNHIRVRGVGNSLQRSQDDNYKSDREKSICEMQQDVARADRDGKSARWELEQLVVLAAREAATGRPAPAPMTLRPPEQRASPSLAAFYCQALGAFGVPEARAAVAQQQRVDSAPRVPPPSAGVVPVNDLPVAQDPGERYQRGAARTAAAIPLENTGLLEAARGRVQDSERTKDTFSVEIEKKFALSVACVVFVLFGAPIALRFPRGGVGLVIGVSMSVFALYYVGLIAGEELADRGVMSPFAAMWATNVLFTVVGLVLFSRMGREGATARGGDAGEFLDALKVWAAKQLRRLGVPVDRRARARA